MSAHDWVVVLITAAISVPIALLSPFGSDRIKEKLASRNRRNAQRRSEEINADFKLITEYKQSPQKFHAYLLARVLLVTLFTIAIQIIDSIASVGVNIPYGIGLTEIGSVTSSVLALVDSVLLTIVLLIGARAYRVYRKVCDYDTYKDSMDQELERLKNVT